MFEYRHRFAASARTGEQAPQLEQGRRCRGRRRRVHRGTEKLLGRRRLAAGHLQSPGQQQQLGTALVPRALAAGRGEAGHRGRRVAPLEQEERCPELGQAVFLDRLQQRQERRARRGLLPGSRIRARRAEQFNRTGNITLKELELPPQRQPVHRAVGGRQGFGAIELPCPGPSERHAPGQRRHFLGRKHAAVLAEALLRLLHLSLFHEQAKQRAGRTRAQGGGRLAIAREARQHAPRRRAVSGIEVGLSGVELEPRLLRAIGALRHRLERPAHGLPICRRRVAAQSLRELAQEVARLDRVGGQHLRQAFEATDGIAPPRAELRIEPQGIG